MVNDELVAQMGPPILQSGLSSGPQGNPPFTGDPSNGIVSTIANNITPSASSNNVVFTREELKELSTIDSQLFGILKLDDPANKKFKATLQKGIKAFEVALLNRWLLLEKSEQNSCNLVASSLKMKNIDSRIYCRLGHYNLFMGYYSKALSAYQLYFGLEPEYWKDSPFLFSLGLIYFHYKAFPWAIKAFKQLIYVDPSFSRVNEAHIRLGLIFKVQKQFGLSFKHFRLALNDSNPCSFGKNEIKFHIAHLYELQGNFTTAKELYLELLNENNLTPTLRSEVFRQLGWMHYNVEALGEKQHRQRLALNYILSSVQNNPDSSQSYYFLGRCHASLSKIHDAFISYRHSVEKAEANADTWCSIGNLYQQQNQPLDALQAYICSAQLKKDHEAAWTNLGTLYENHGQVHDAYKCYIHATRRRGTKANPALVERLQFLKTALANFPQIAPSGSQQKIPSLEEAWNHSVSNEMATRQNSNYRQQIPLGLTPDEQLKRLKGELCLPGRINNFNSYHFIEQNHPIHHKMVEGVNMKQTHVADSFALPNSKMSPSIPVQLNNNVKTPLSSGTFNSHLIHPAKTSRSFRDSVDSDAMSNHTQSSDDSISCTPEGKETYSSQFTNFNTANSVTSSASSLINNNNNNNKEEAVVASILCNPYLQMSSADPSQNGASSTQPQLNISMTAQQVIAACENVPVNTKIVSSIVSDYGEPPLPPDSPYPPVFCEPDSFLPTPCIMVESKKDAFGMELQRNCLQHPIVIIRNLASVLKLDLGLFSTKTLVESNPDHTIEVRRQLSQPSDANYDEEQGRHIWPCKSTRSHTTIAKYAHYQASSFNESLKEERERASGPNLRDPETDSNSNIPKFFKNKHKIVKFGTNVDLSEDSKWKPQLQELAKLPNFARVVSGFNMLSHVGHTIYGMNSVQLYMKVPGCRTPGHQENNNFCSVNINIGPGECEWFGVAPEYWGVIHRLCEKNNTNYLHGSWWPLQKDLEAENIPVYKFMQKPGDIVWVGAGTVHWVQASGWCNNIAWNVGPFTAQQYELAISRYEWNKHEHYKSIVPMIHLTWNLAQNIRVFDNELFSLMKSVLLRSFKHCLMVVNFVKSLGHEIQWHGRGKNEPSHYCANCEVEVFHILFVKKIDGKHVVHCFDCARKVSPQLDGFVILEEHKLSELSAIYDKFVIYTC
ncbi:PREDICTED: lysine-specific demethylase 6A-like [Rhagoletis zephyria]|uniref:lysine-specific demethylase 6A-like n=1 Tax=Rhagoletis zephyria TaxID=28612 RepID=UPI00081130F2|nr:PREDICTED: lysine-specific demethylase 6A-like [Rhagoletis zephyria]